MGHERSKTVTVHTTTPDGRRVKRYANIDTVGKNAGAVLGGRTFGTMDDALIEADTRSFMSDRTGPTGHHRPAGTTPRSAASRKNPRDPNKPRNPKLK